MYGVPLQQLRIPHALDHPKHVILRRRNSRRNNEPLITNIVIFGICLFADPDETATATATSTPTSGRHPHVHQATSKSISPYSYLLSGEPCVSRHVFPLALSALFLPDWSLCNNGSLRRRQAFTFFAVNQGAQYSGSSRILFLHLIHRFPLVLAGHFSGLDNHSLVFWIILSTGVFYAYLGSTLDRLAYLRDYTATTGSGPTLSNPHFRIVILRAANFWSTFTNCCV